MSETRLEAGRRVPETPGGRKNPIPARRGGEAASGDGLSDAYLAAVKPRLTAFGNKEAKENDEMNTAQVMFFAPEDIEVVAQEVARTLEGCESVAKVKEIKVKEWQERLKKPCLLQKQPNLPKPPENTPSNPPKPQFGR
jgi:hypothetical protein